MKPINSVNEYQRILWLHSQLKRGFLTFEKFEDKFEHTQRTYQRDLEKMKLYLEAPIIRQGEFHKYSDATFELPQVILTSKELAGLYTAIGICKRYAGTPILNTLEKISKVIPEDNKSQSLEIDTLVHKDVVINWHIYNKLLEAFQKKISVMVEYKSTNSGVTWRKIDPYHFYVYKEEFYLAAYCHKNSEVRDFNLARCLEICLTTDTFVVSWDKEKYFAQKNWGIIKGEKVEEVVLKIQAEKFDFLIEGFKSRFEVLERDGEFIFLKTETTITQEFVSWILTYSLFMEVLEPKSLRKEIILRCNQIINKYK